MSTPERAHGENPTGENPDGSAWVPARAIDRRRPSWGRRLLLLLLVAVPILVVAGLVVIPPLLPKDPRAVVIEQYLEAVRTGEEEKAAELGVLDEPPLTASVGRIVEREDVGDAYAGAYEPIAQFHRDIGQKYTPRGDVYLKEDMTGTLAKMLNLRKEAAVKGEAIAKKIERGRPEDLFDAAEGLAEGYSGIFDAILGPVDSPAKAEPIVLTYEDLVAEHAKDLGAEQRLLLDDFAANRDKWERLLGRDPRELNAKGEFRVDDTVWETRVWLPGQSSGEPPKTVRFTLRRFRVDLIDTGWKVWSQEVVTEDE